MKKRLFTVLFAASMIFLAGKSEAYADDNDELFEIYAQDRLYEGVDSVDVSMYSSNVSEKKLTGSNKAAYSLFKEKIKKIADGESDSAVVSIYINDLFENKEFTAADLGVSTIVSDGSLTVEAQDAMNAKLPDSSIVVKTLMDDCPYELYWFDKTKGWYYRYNSYEVKYNGTEYVLYFPDDAQITISFIVDELYRGTQGNYSVNTAMTGSVISAVNNAKDIVNQAQYKSDYEKLVYYKDKICELTEYNYSAADSGPDKIGTISPWQLVYVFDNDPTTKVVCEGYSKAFSYLCELTEFESEEVYAHLASGIMKCTIQGSGSSGGGHMWNIVHMPDGLNYLVDVTNCDEGSVGYSDKLFMQGYDSAITNGYEYSFVQYGKSVVVQYTYDADTLNIHDASDLKIASSDYVKPAVESGIRLAGHSISLDGAIGLHYYMELSDEVVNDKSTYMEFTLSDESVRRVSIDEAKIKSVEGVNYYVFMCDLTSIEMTDVVKARLHTSTTVSDAYLYTVKEYADYIIAHKDESTQYSDAYESVRALLTYGAYAQEYFEYNIDKLPTDDRVDVSHISDSTIAEFNYSKRDVDDVIKCEGASLQLLSEITANLYFTSADESVDINTVSFVYNGKELTKYKYEDMYYVKLEGIKVNEMSDACTLEISYNNGESVNVSFEYTPMTYCYNVLSRPITEIRTEKVKNLIKSIVLLNKSLKDYIV